MDDTSNLPDRHHILSDLTDCQIKDALLRLQADLVAQVKETNHALAHELVSDSPAIVGFLATWEMQFFVSLLAVSPIIGMIVEPIPLFYLPKTL